MFGDPLGRITDDPRHADEEGSAVLEQSESRHLVVMFTERGEVIQPDHRAGGDAE